MEVDYRKILLLIAAATPCSAGAAPVEEFKLGDADLREIRSQVLTAHAELASSPGIRYAEADRWDGEEFAIVIFAPHVDSGGIKQAFQVECVRQAPATDWQCEEAQIRRYVRVEGQAFEVRVVGDIGAGAIVAVIEATRRALPTDTGDGPYRAIIARPAETGYMVQWANDRENVSLHATLSDGADPARPGDWQVSRYLFPVVDAAVLRQDAAPDRDE